MDALLAWITAHPHWAGLAVWLVAFSESLAIVGLFMPGALLLFGIGTLVGLGHLELWPTLAWAFAGAVLGDGLSFWIGRHYRQQLRTLWPFRNYPRLVNRGVDFFHRHGGKSVLFGRFVGPVRPIVPAVAGMLEMPVGRYLAINLGSALAWAPAYLLPGVVFGASLELAAAVTGRLAALLLLSLALGWLVLVAARLLLRLLQPRARQLVEGLLAWGHHHPRFAALAAAVGDPGGPEARGLAVLAGALVALFALAALAVEAVAGLPLAWDPWLHEFLAALRNPLADRLLIGVSQLGDSLFLGIYSAAVFAWLVARRERGLALHWLAVVGFAWLAPELLKHGFQVGRPAPHDAGGDGFSFPSGHAVGATAVYGFVAVVLARALAPAWRWLPYGGAAVLVTGIAFSRVYLGMHWPTDVAAGVLLGGAWVVLLGTAYRVRPFPQPAGRALAALLLGLPLLLALAYLPLRAEQDRARYLPATATRAVAAAQWWQAPWPALGPPPQEAPAAAAGRWLQWAASREQLLAGLRPRGWLPAARLGALGALQWLNPGARLDDLPPLPQVLAGQFEPLRLVQGAAAGASRDVLRLWDSGVRLEPGAVPVWVGYLGRERIAHPLGLFSYPRTEAAPAEALAALVAAMRSDWRVREDPAGTALAGPATLLR